MIEIKTWGGETVAWLEDPCTHEAAVPVDSVVDGAVVAWLCPDCDAQLPAGWQ